MDKPNPDFIVKFDKIMVNSIETNSGIFVGTNTQYGWSSHSKTNASISGISGDGNVLAYNVNVIYDDDLIDTPIDDRDVMLHSNKTVARVS